MEHVRSLGHVQIPDGMHHNERDQENGTSCKPRSVIRDLEILRRENRGTDLIDDAENHSSKRSRTIERSPRGLLECRLHIPKSGDAPGHVGTKELTRKTNSNIITMLVGHHLGQP